MSAPAMPTITKEAFEKLCALGAPPPLLAPKPESSGPPER